MKKKGFTLVEVLAVIVIIAIILVIALPKISDFLLERKNQNFITSARALARELEYNNMDYTTFNVAKIKDLDLYNIDEDFYDLDKSIAYTDDDNKVYVNLVGKGPYEGLYVCQTSSQSKDVVVQTTPCEEKIIRYVDFSINLDGGTTEQQFDSSYAQGKQLTLIPPSKNGYTFGGWELISGNSIVKGNRLKFGSTTTSIKAKWVNNPTLVVNLNGGTTTQHFESVYQGGTQITLVDPTKNKNIFSHWSTTGGILSGKNFTIGSTNTTLTANWLAITQLTVNLNGGTTTQYFENTYVERTIVPLRTPTKVGYTFTGWTTNNGTINENGWIVGSEYNTTLTANWTVMTITCPAGQYLRASDATCQTCPGNGIYCPGGTFTYNGSDQGKTNCPTGYAMSNVGASANTACYMEVAGGKYKTTKTGATTANCASGTYKEAHKSYYDSTDSCDSCPTGYTKSDTNATLITQCYIEVAGGKYKTTQTGAATANCASGTYKEAHKSYYNSSDSCTSCPTGYTKSDTNATRDTQCYIEVAGGKYKTTQTGAATANCASGTYKAAHNSYYNSSDSCTSCPTGYTRSNTNATADTQCYMEVAGGKYKETATGATVKNCASGTYKEAHNSYYNSSDSCTSCPTGYTKSDTNATRDTQCYIEVVSGKYKETATGATTINCAVGHESENHKSYYNSLDSCSASTISCGEGKYLRASDATCASCPGGGVYCKGGSWKYDGTDKGKTSCPTGYNKSNIGAKVDTECYIDVGTNKYKTTPKGATVQACAAGYESAAHTSYYNSSDACLPSIITCAAGKYLRASDRSCQPCPGGGVYCPGGTFTYNGSDQGKVNCPTGYTKSLESAGANTQCYIDVSEGKYKTEATKTTTANCSTGYYKDFHQSYYNSTDGCSKCPANTYSAAGAGACTQCGTGYFSGEGASSCTSYCNEVNYVDGTTCSASCSGGTYNRLAYSKIDPTIRCPEKDEATGGSVCNTKSCCQLVCTAEMGDLDEETELCKKTAGLESSTSTYCPSGSSPISGSGKNFGVYNKYDCWSTSQFAGWVQMASKGQIDNYYSYYFSYYSTNTTYYCKEGWTRDGNICYKTTTPTCTEAYTVKYNSNGGSGTMSNTTCPKNQNCKLRANTFTRSGYVFLGWSTSSTATTATYTNQQIISLNRTDDLTLYAVWRVSICPQIHCDTGGSAGWHFNPGWCYNNTARGLSISGGSGDIQCEIYDNLNGHGNPNSGRRTITNHCRVSTAGDWTANVYVDGTYCGRCTFTVGYCYKCGCADNCGGIQTTHGGGCGCYGSNCAWDFQ